MDKSKQDKIVKRIWRRTGGKQTRKRKEERKRRG